MLLVYLFLTSVDTDMIPPYPSPSPAPPASILFEKISETANVSRRTFWWHSS